MPDYKIIVDPTIEIWNSFLKEMPGGNLEQSYEYGEISRNAFSRTNVVRLALSREESKEYTGIIQGAYSSYFGFGMTLGVTRGPLVNRNREDFFQLVKYLITELEDYCKKNRIICIQMCIPENWGMDNLLDILRYTEVGTLNSYIVNFGSGIEELWKNIDHNKRRNIRKAIKEEVEICQSHDVNDLKKFFLMLEAAKERRKFNSYPSSWFNACWEIYPSKLSRVFLARWKKKVVSGAYTIFHGDTVYSLGAGSYKEGWQARPNDMMQWKIMEWAFMNGYKKYNMGLMSDPPPNKDSNTWGIWRWKREWKGNLEKMRVYEKILSPRYEVILKTKKMVERNYYGLRQLI